VTAVAFGLLALEIVERLVFDVALPHGRDLLWDTLARLGRLGALGAVPNSPSEKWKWEKAALGRRALPAALPPRSLRSP
jgi:hypothetical protein